jgi:hypothetical protein
MIKSSLYFYYRLDGFPQNISNVKPSFETECLKQSQNCVPDVIEIKPSGIRPKTITQFIRNQPRVFSTFSHNLYPYPYQTRGTQSDGYSSPAFVSKRIFVTKILRLKIPVQFSRDVIFGSLHRAIFPPNICTPYDANTNRRTMRRMDTSRISLNPLHNSNTTFLMCGTRL